MMMQTSRSLSRHVVIVAATILTISSTKPFSALAQPLTASTRSDLVVIDASKADKSIDPALITYVGSAPNMYGQPMRVLIPERFANEAGLVATARRLAKDNARYPLVVAPVQIYSDANPTRELAEYWNNKQVHDLRLNDSDGVLQKIIAFHPHDYRPHE